MNPDFELFSAERSAMTRRAFYPKGSIIFRQGETRTHAYILESGTVELHSEREPQGGDTCIDELSPGALFGEMALLSDGNRTATAVTSEDSYVFILSRDILRARLGDLDPIVSLLMSLLIERYRTARIRHPELDVDLGQKPSDVDLSAPAGPGSLSMADIAAKREQALTELKIEQEMRHALEEDQFQPYLQPIVSLIDRRLLGFEALIRWIHPERGMIPPNDFVPVAERTHVVQMLDELMLRRVCAELPDLIRSAGDCPRARALFISVNLSGVNFEDRQVTKMVRNVLDSVPISPRNIKFEITESALIGDPEHAKDSLKALKDMGVSIALDDFGTGYSSLSYLHKFAIDFIKVDRAFVSQIQSDPKSLDIVRAIAGLAQNFKLELIAEGIENREEIAALSSLGCTMGQGFYFGKPMPLKEARQFAIDNLHGQTG